MRILAALLPILVVAPLAHAAPATPESFAFGTHSVIVPARKLGFVMTERAGTPELVAVDLTTGKVRWRSTVAYKPIAVRGDKLVALAGSGQALVLDARTGKKQKKCGELNVRAPFVDGLGSHNEARGHDDGTALYLVSTTDTHHVGGARPTPEMEARARSHGSGAWVLDLATCRVTATSATIGSPLAVTSTRDVTTSRGSTVHVVRDLQTGTSTLAPAKGASEIDLTEGDPRRTTVGLSSDLRHVACGDDTSKVAVFDLETGAVTRPAVFSPAQPWIAMGTSTLLGAGGLRLVDRGGKVVWSIGERSTLYRGPYPPSRP